jgi:hypothetical protein
MFHPGWFTNFMPPKSWLTLKEAASKWGIDSFPGLTRTSYSCDTFRENLFAF